jgi:hypothetical protein
MSAIVDLNTRGCIPIPSCANAERTIAAVTQMFLSLTGGDQSRVDVVATSDLHLQTRIAKHLTNAVR